MNNILSFLPIAFIFSAALSHPQLGIIGGHDASVGQFPYQVSIQQCDIFFCSHYCGGSIIGPKWIITAGHCYSYGEKFQVVAGVTNLKEDSQYKQVILVNHTFVHEDYIGNANPNDIALIQLAEPLVYNERIQPIALPERGLEVTGPAVTSGWGKTGGNLFPIMPDNLQYLEFSILTGQECIDALDIALEGDRNPFNLTTNVCTTDTEGGHGICNGDSGSPLSQNGTFVGLASWVVGNCAQKGAPDVFTKISNYIEWINKHVG